MKIEEMMYETETTSRGGRNGEATTADETMAVELDMPESMGGPGEPGTNPEQLFGMAYAACYESALRQHASDRGIETGPIVVTARVSLGKTAQEDLQLGVTLEADLPDMNSDEGMDLMKAAHATCPYSRAVRGNVDVELVVR